MTTILRKLGIGLWQAFPSGDPILNRVGHALAAAFTAAVVMAAVTVLLLVPRWFALAFFASGAIDAALFGAWSGLMAGTGAYGFREAEQAIQQIKAGTEPDPGGAWDFYAGVIGAALPLVGLLLIRFFNLL